MLRLKYLICEVSKPNTTKENLRVKALSSPLIRLTIDFCDCYFYSSEQANICHPAPALLSPPFWLFFILFRPLGVPPLTPQVPVTDSIPFQCGEFMQLQASPESNVCIYISFRASWIKLSSTIRNGSTSYLGFLQGASWLRLDLSDSCPSLVLLLLATAWPDSRAESTWWYKHSLWFVPQSCSSGCPHWRAVWLHPWLTLLLTKNWAGRGTVHNQVSSRHGFKLK